MKVKNTRVERVKNKFLTAIPELAEFESKEDVENLFIEFFTPKQRRFLSYALERYFDHTTLDEIGKREGNVSREYIRQCEEKALQIMKNAIDENKVLF